jgi:RNA polymerase sigma factor (sigma-70 family)
VFLFGRYEVSTGRLRHLIGDRTVTDTNTHTGSTDLALLGRTQRYLKSLLSQQVPDSLLEESWDVFYSIYTRLIRRFVLARGIKHTEVDDCLQDVWGEVATRLVDFEHPVHRPGLRAWLYTLVRSKATDIVRRKIKQGVVGVGENTAARCEPRSREADPTDEIERQWGQAVVQTTLEDLQAEVSSLNYNVLYMRFMENRSVSEVAEALNLKPEQVRYRQHRMLKKLRTRQRLIMGEPFGKEI